MKKLKYRLERRICDFLSANILYCEGKGYFKISNVFGYPLLDHRFRLDITKLNSNFSYYIILKRSGVAIFNATIEYDIYRKDVPIQKSYTIKDLGIVKMYDNITSLKEILEQIKNKGRT